MAVNKAKEIREKEILDAAFRCFSKKGIVKTSIDDVAGEAGLTKGGVYWYFKDKREIYIAMIERHIQEDIATWKELVENSDLRLDSIIEFGINYLRYSVSDRDHLFIHAEFFAESFTDETLREKLNKAHREYRDMLREILGKLLEKSSLSKSDFDIDNISCLILACLEGIEHQYWCSGSDDVGALYEKVWANFVTIHLGDVIKDN
jgi:AcrR family transcriptional regulator